MAQTDGLPFKMIQKTTWEQWRASTFWVKEPETIAWIDSFQAGEGSLFIDVGACIGCYSLYAASKWPKMQILAIEPHPENFHRLDLNCAVNRFKNVVAVCCGIGRQSICGVFEFGDLTAGTSGGQIMSQQGKMYSFGRGIFSLDDLYCKLVSTYPRAVWIKVDIDGQEGEVLTGMHSLLRHPSLKGLLVEFNSDSERRFWTEQIVNRGLTDANRFMRMENHSNRRREANPGDKSRNVIFTRI